MAYNAAFIITESAMDDYNDRMIKYLTISKKSAIAYALWLFAGLLGSHNFYVGRYILAITELSLFIFGLIGPSISGFVWFIIIPCLIYDLFVLGTEVKKYNIRLKKKLGE